MFQSPESGPDGRRLARGLPPDAASINIVFTLWPLRGTAVVRAGLTLATLVLPPGADNVVFDVRLASHASPPYAMTLTDLTLRRVVWRTTQVTRRCVGDHASAAAVISAGILLPRVYALDLVGRNPRGSVARIHSPFVVSRDRCRRDW
jgi:hypothetical protein